MMQFLSRKRAGEEIDKKSLLRGCSNDIDIEYFFLFYEFIARIQ